MISIQLLEKDDILDSKDWCRPLNFMSMSGGQSDVYAFESFGRPCNNAKWVSVAVSYPFWVGKKVKELPERVQDYEFVRGNVPNDHIHVNGRETAKQRELRREVNSG